MQRDERDLLEVLKAELAFLEQGGYSNFPKATWRPPYIFEDSPVCLNYGSKENRTPCRECVLMHLVPPEHRSATIPCRHIPFNAAGETLDSLYRYNDQVEIEGTVASWLRATIQWLEEERAAIDHAQSKPPAAAGNTLKGTPLYQKQHPKCANPACPTAFHWTGGGKFFRFRPDVDSESEGDATVDSPRGIHGVRHYWLCESCSHVFTLLYQEGNGITVQLVWPEMKSEHAPKEQSGARRS
jgi:hypothetical protein